MHVPHVCQGQERPTHLLARFLGPALAGLLEFSVFYPMDTIAKRLMSHHGAIIHPTHPSQTREIVKNIIFREAGTQSIGHKFRALYPGVSFGIAYKISQRVYKFGGQPLVKDFLKKSSYADFLCERFGSKKSRIMLEATAGACVGAGEIMLLPIDVLKIKAQTNPAVLANRSVFEIIAHERCRLFAGASWTVARNVPGSLALFGGSAAVKEFVFHLDEGAHPTLFQTFVASAGGSLCSLIASSPFDVIKTRVQNQPFDQPVSGRAVIKDILQNEGVSAFARGIIPKILTVGPKLVCSFTAAQYLTRHVSNQLHEAEKQL